MDNADLTKINIYPDYIALINRTITMNSRLQSCIQASKIIDESTKEEIFSKNIIKLNQDLTFSFNSTLPQQQVLNARIKFCVLNVAFTPCNCYQYSIIGNETSSGSISGSIAGSSSGVNGGNNGIVDELGSSENFKDFTKKDFLQESKAFRRLAMEGNCQKCEERGMVGCLINYLNNHQRAKDAIRLDNNYCYSDKTVCEQKVWKNDIFDLISEENLEIIGCLASHHCCSTFGVEEVTGTGMIDF